MNDHLGNQLDAYLDGTLSTADQKNVEDHLRQCQMCQSQLTMLKNLAKRLETPEAAPDVSFKPYWKRLLSRHQEVKTMTTIQRLQRVVESNVHAAIDAMEDPSKMIRQLLREMDHAIAGAREELVAAMVAEKTLNVRLQEATTHVKKWDGRAALALRHDKVDLAREALREQMALELLVEDLNTAWKKQQGRVAALRGSLTRIERQSEDLRRRKALWLSQAQQQLGGLRPRNAYEAAYSELLRMVDVVQDRTIVDVTVEDIEQAPALDEEIDAIDHRQQVDQRLTALRQRIQGA